MKLMKTLLASAVALSAMPALAYEAGDIIVKAGLVNVAPKDNSADTSAVTSLVLAKADNSSMEIDSNVQLGITGVYMVTNNFGVEVLAATPFEHTASVKGGDLDGTDLVTVKHLPPTVSAQYYPMDAASKLQPYIGLGLNHTFFFDEKDEAGLGIKGLKPSWGLTYSAGVDYMIDDKWLVNAAVWKMDIDTEVKGSAADGMEVEIDPLVVMVGAGMKF
ncbi:OmpW/AlkL family protein [Thalassolituus marinus]|uniref:Outer membrane beta-barrel protein n=1 Tax=Thalassolituus marinus TaxID=671053 RepID=A0ABS7ZM31_9GAMM|nr:OmpW family outer membrane protein [Thalassolituus marinus]MCA6062771.1 outer membrane beta-barrel protein [Thalassolituus marinus]